MKNKKTTLKSQVDMFDFLFPANRPSCMLNDHIGEKLTVTKHFWLSTKAIETSSYLSQIWFAIFINKECSISAIGITYLR